MAKSRILRVYLLSILAWFLAMFTALRLGAVDHASFDILMLLRLPRAMLASAIGMGLAVAGAALQALFTNPLCEPYTLGISSGAAFGAVLGISLGLEWNFAGLMGTSFTGALLFAFILFGLSSRRRSNNSTLLLSGVMLGFFGTSVVALWISLTDSNGIHAAIGWLFGDLSRARMSGAWMTLGVVAALVFFIWGHWRELDALLMGEEGAQALGVDVSRVRRRMVLLNSLLVGVCVSAGGMIGFVGLVVPHFVRRLVGSMHFHLLPLASIWGAIALTLADCGARFLARPYELPVGVITALMGAPIFLWIILGRQNAK